MLWPMNIKHQNLTGNHSQSLSCRSMEENTKNIWKLHIFNFRSAFCRKSVPMKLSWNFKYRLLTTYNVHLIFQYSSLFFLMHEESRDWEFLKIYELARVTFEDRGVEQRKSRGSIAGSGKIHNIFLWLWGEGTGRATLWSLYIYIYILCGNLASSRLFPAENKLTGNWSSTLFHRPCICTFAPSGEWLLTYYWISSNSCMTA